MPLLFKRLPKPLPVGLLPLVFLMLLFVQLSSPSLVLPQQQTSPIHSAKKILVLYTYGDGLPGYRKASAAFWPVITGGGVSTDDVFSEYLDLQRNNSAEYRQRLTDLLRYKYAMREIGLIITVHTEALNFLLNEGKGLFPDVPVFSYLIVRPELIEAKNTGRRILQRPQNLDIGGTLEIALKMFPETRKVVFVTGTANGDRRLEHEARRIFEPWRDKLEFQYTSDRSLEEILQLVASLPSRSIVIYNNVFSDTTGRTFIPLEVGKRVAKAANAPVFCLWDTLMGSGPIGGSLLSFEAEGAYAANVALEILDGKILLTKPVTTLPTSKTFMFDWQPLSRWRVDESILPKGSIVLNRPKTLWGDYKGFVIGGIAIFLAQALLVIGLLVQRSLRRKAEWYLRQRTEELDQFFNVNLDLLCIANTDGYFLRLNPAWERILGYTREELMDKRFLEFVHPDDLDKTLEAVSALVSQQKVFSFENRYRCKDGTYRWLQWSSAPAGNLIYAAARDVTEHKQFEESLRKAEEKYRNIFEGSVEGIFETSPQGQPLTANPAMAKILGYDSLDEFVSFIQDSAHQVFADPDKRREYVGLLENQNVVLGFECELLRRDGTKIWASLNSRRVCGPDGKTLFYSGFLEDITERKRAEEEVRKHQKHLEELVEELRKYQEHLEDLVRERTAILLKAMDQAEAANRAKSAFLANMSHELRAPLNSILGVAQLMERDREFPAKQRELLEILSRSGQQLFELIDDVLEMSRIEAGQTTIVSKTFDLHRFLDDLEEMMSLRAEKKGLPLIFERDSELPKYIQTDGRKLRQILINLLGNAIKFTEKGRVTLRTNFKEGMAKAPGDEPASLARLEFEVEDTGIGLAQEDREKIFDPFMQLNPAQKPSGGIGLGLAICHKFAALLGGAITVRSQVGRGTTFKLDIGVQPAERSDTPAQEVRREVMGLASGQPDYRLLVVDDNLESRLLLRRLLEPVGFRVLEAASGPEAIDLYRKDRLDLIWMDIRMPGMDGYEAARRIREAERERRNEDGQEIHTPIIALTAGVMEDIGSPSLSWLFDDWVYKPFRETEVFDKIEKHLGVQFVSQASVLSTGKPYNTQDKAALTPADLSVLPADWLKEFFQTMEKGRSAQLLNLIDQIRPEHADLALALAEMVRIHQYEKLIPLTREALKEDANG